MFRTGVFSTVLPYQQGPLGGASREYPLFAQDADKRHELKDCSKNQYAQGALSPGVLVRSAPHPPAMLRSLPRAAE